MSAEPPLSIGARLAANGWMAGSVLTHEALLALQPQMRHGLQEQAVLSEHTWAIVISQTCDLLAGKDDAEPYFELLLAEPIAASKPRSQFMDLRSTRQLDFRPHREQQPAVILNAHATARRYLLPRSLLTTYQPDATRKLSAAAVQRLVAWLALRIARPAWPDAFVQRIDAQKQTLLNALDALKDDIAEVRVAIAPNDQELGAATDYEIAVFFVMDEEKHAQTSLRTQVTAAHTQFVAALALCPGIVLNALSQVADGSSFSWQLVQQTDLWNFAQLSPYE